MSSQEVKVCHLSDFHTHNRLSVEIDDRKVVLFHHKGRVFALDQKCYHAGGPLNKGKIEDIEDYSCVVCPWHKRKICLSTGNDLLECDDGKIVVESGKQRTHQVRVDAAGNVFVLSSYQQPSDGGKYESDVFNKTEEK